MLTLAPPTVGPPSAPSPSRPWITGGLKRSPELAPGSTLEMLPPMRRRSARSRPPRPGTVVHDTCMDALDVLTRSSVHAEPAYCHMPGPVNGPHSSSTGYSPLVAGAPQLKHGATRRSPPAVFMVSAPYTPVMLGGG